MADTPSSATYRILVVDDLVSVREALRELLARPGIEVVLTNGASAATKEAQRNGPPIALVCLDLKLDDHGDGDGYTTTGSLRALLPETPIFIVSNRDRGLDRMETARQGATAYLPKGRLFAEDNSGAALLYETIRTHAPTLASFYA